MISNPFAKVKELETRLERERESRKAAEHLLEEKTREVYEKSRALEKAAEELTRQNEDLRQAHEEILAHEEELRQTLEELMATNEEMARTQKALVVANAQLKDSERELESKVELRTRELLHAKEAAERANKVKSEFLANMSHELRTPLNAILGYAQILSDDPAVAPGVREKIRIINKSGEHLLGLINSVLDLSKIEAGRMELHPSNFDLLALMQQVYDMFRLRCENKGVKLLFEANAAVPKYVFADEAKLRQCLINLVGNAVKFTKSGEIRLDVERWADDRTAFKVRDTGRGVPKEKIAAILEPFTQIHSQLNTEGGTGLGLSITKSFVQLMGGEIFVESEEGVGSLFTIAVPLTEVESVVEKDSGPPRKVLRIASERRPKVLVVDDNPINRDVAAEILRLVGFEVSFAENGKQAIDQTLDIKPEIVLMDIRMPVMDGLEATNIIRTTEFGKSVKIMAVTASAFDQNREEFLAQGCDGYMAKPYKSLALLEDIGRLLNLEYEYEYFEAGAETAGAENIGEFSLEAVKAAASEELVATWEKMVLQGRLDGLPDAIEALNVQAFMPFASIIRQKVDDFDYDGVEALLARLK